MTRKTSVLFSIALILGASGAAFAGSKTPRVDAREHRQQHRIHQGIRSGELTAKEVARLEAEQARIRVYEARAKADGHVTTYERARLNRELNQSNRRIHRQKHD
jgi:hypothetical protein